MGATWSSKVEFRAWATGRFFIVSPMIVMSDLMICFQGLPRMGMPSVLHPVRKRQDEEEITSASGKEIASPSCWLEVVDVVSLNVTPSRRLFPADPMRCSFNG
ncbi:uncharacterized protein BDZ83DRAFT_647813 [Colletotrichum acutatum]|uniref:Uncharacterized protein n=1 Tax=Glomerella acutata TaxID=27357 RepID=A0AAD9D0U0_GLOAC|nr:uncharacterized protein BDZ83DRAFT_647813 [Colletotrichum acutatum]KAK1729520.1 hypothetical protein BDZ83DRAFT_647813 [Colletotrichum acutatum]